MMLTPLTPIFTFYIEKKGLQEYTLLVLFLLKSIDCGYSLEPSRRGGSNEYPYSMFFSRNMINIRIFICFFFFFFFFFFFYFLVVKFSVYIVFE